MSDIYATVKGPVITEKVTMESEKANKVAFWVDIKATKGKIREAVEGIFNVKVKKVNSMRIPGKLRRMGKSEGKTPTRKKAYVTLREGDKIEIFEGV